MRPPGLLRANVEPEVIMMICTAGHVDHGKTSLVKYLTGCNTDRLKVEQERGMTIELGFAPCMLGGDLCVGIVDVPGHEKFVRNMVAGVSGIDLAILVIAADDGIMPQTVEHFQIMQLLGVRHGIVALTKTDLVTPERVTQVAASISNFLAGTFMDGAPICPVSNETGDGVFDFYDKLVERIRGLAKQRKRGIFRMPIERVFTQKGFGTVVTGIPVDGAVEIGAEVEIAPGGQHGRVRGIQRFLRNTSDGGYGQCLAINVPELSRKPPERGQVLCQPGYLKAVRHFYVHLNVVSGLDRPLTNAENIKFHTGTAEEMGRLALLGEKTLNPGDSAFVMISVAHPVAAAVHDRFIIRRPSPAATVGGGEILVATDTPLRGLKEQIREKLAAYRSLFRGIDPASQEGINIDIQYTMRLERPYGVSVDDLAKSVLLPLNVVRESLSRLTLNSSLRGVPDEAIPPVLIELQPDFFIHQDCYAARLAEVEARVKSAAENNTLALALSDLRKGLADWPPALWGAVQKELEQKSHVTVRGAKLVLNDAIGKLGATDRELLEKILQIYEESKFESPRPDELPERVHATQAQVDRLLNYLCDAGMLVKLAKNVILSYKNFKLAQDIVVETIQQRGALDSADFKYAIQSSRKYALAILDFLDTRRVTIRSDNNRKLAADYQRNLMP